MSYKQGVASFMFGLLGIFGLVGGIENSPNDFDEVYWLLEIVGFAVFCFLLMAIGAGRIALEAIKK